MDAEKEFMRRAISLAQNGMTSNEGGPFGAIVVQNGKVVGVGNNRVTSSNDPTAHAEVVAIRDACRNLNTFQLSDCEIYTSCEPCPMCLGAIYWSRPQRIFIACNRQDAAEAAFDDEFIYEEISSTDFASRKVPIAMLMREEGLAVFRSWIEKPDKIEY